MAVSVISIRWERTLLTLDFTSDGDEQAQLYLYRIKERRFIPFEMSDDGTMQHATINISIAGGREMLPAGEWIVCNRIPDEQLTSMTALLEARPHLWNRARRDTRKMGEPIEKDDPDHDEKIEQRIIEYGLPTFQKHPYDTHGIVYATDIMEDIERYSRVFRYGGAAYAYTIVAIPRVSSANDLFLVFDATFYIKNYEPHKRKGSKRFAEKQILSTYFRICRALSHKTGKRVLFLKENGEGPTENMKALQDRIIERGLDREFDITYRYRNVYSGRQQLFAWLKDLALIAKNDYIFVDDYAPVFNFTELDGSSTLTQIWHAGVGFKSVGYARFGIKGSPDPYASGHRKYTYALVGNAELRDIYSEVFGIEKEALLATGMPRLDHFLDADTAETARKDLYERYPQLRDGRVILFAPTFRGTGQKTAHYPYKFLDNEKLYEMCVRTNSYFIYEMHHFIRTSPEIEERFADRILDLSEENLNELYFISDVLVTDYSSCFYDYLLLRKPVVFYMPDKLSYTAIRGVQRPIDEMAPGIVVEDFDEFVGVLEERRYESVSPNSSSLDRAIEGGMLASDRAIDTILLHKNVPGVRLAPSSRA